MGAKRASSTTRLQHAWRRVTAHMNPPVFFGSAFTVIAFVAFGGGWTELASGAFGEIKDFVAVHFGWFYVLVVTVLLVLVLALALTRYGRVRLGRAGDRPEFHVVTWFAMLFAAGMGTGLVFFGVAEPLMHWDSPPLAEPRSREAVAEAMRLSFFHWGVHPWAIYIVFGATLALFHFRFRLPLAPRSMLWPLLGQGIHGRIGHAVDILCTVGTLMGVAASLGLGAQQINTGLEHMGVVSRSTDVQLGIIMVITLVATVSVVSGIHHGIRRLSQINLGLSGALLLFVLVTGPTLFLIELLLSSAGEYLAGLVRMSLWTAPFDDRAQQWQEDWTLSYWGWWLAWSPFVGVFVARVSRGRTVREFVAALMLVPVAMSFTWMAVFGGTALTVAEGGAGRERPDTEFAERVTSTPALGLHELLDRLPFGAVTGVAATVLTVVFFVTSSDSGSLVDDMVTSGGDPDPPRKQRVFWAVSEGVMAATLLLTGGIPALRTAVIAVGLPMGVLIVFGAIALVRGVQRAARA